MKEQAPITPVSRARHQPKPKKVLNEKFINISQNTDNNYRTLNCLPKIHKPNFPLRPIVSSINTPNSKISKYLAKILPLLKYAKKASEHTGHSILVAHSLSTGRRIDFDNVNILHREENNYKRLFLNVVIFTLKIIQ